MHILPGWSHTKRVNNEKYTINSGPMAMSIKKREANKINQLFLDSSSHHNLHEFILKQRICFNLSKQLN